MSRKRVENEQKRSRKLAEKDKQTSKKGGANEQKRRSKRAAKEQKRSKKGAEREKQRSSKGAWSGSRELLTRFRNSSAQILALELTESFISLISLSISWWKRGLGGISDIRIREIRVKNIRS